jgi:1-deoxy-D-xylulose-5-phosphate reductoisomerase
LAAQALEFGVEVVAVARAGAVSHLQAVPASAKRRGFATGQCRMPNILAGPKALTD